MNIHDKRLKLEIDQIIKENLSRGYVPTSNEVIGELSQYLSNNNLSVPSFKYAKKSKSFTAEDFNGAKEFTLQDLEIVYDALVELYQLADEQVDKFVTEKQKCDYRLATMQAELECLINRYSSTEYNKSYVNSFTDMSGIDMQFDTATTTVPSMADIDIVNHEATLRRLQDIAYTDFTVSVSTEETTLKQNGSIDQFLNTRGATWQGIIEKGIQEATEMTIAIDTKAVNGINKLEISFPLLKECNATVISSVDGDKWNREFTGIVVDKCAVNFSNRLRYIRIILTKSEADKFNLGKFQYFFIVDSIKLSSINYAMESAVVSKSISVGSNINRISIYDTSITPPSTSIEYFIKNPNTETITPISPVNWPNKTYSDIVSFNTVNTDQRIHISLPSGVSKDAYELKNLSVNGQHLYAIYEIGPRANGNPIDITSYKLYKGINAWKVETLAMNVAGPQTQAIFLQNRNAVQTSYIPIVTDKPGLILNNKSYQTSCITKYTTTIQRDGNDTIIKEMIASTSPVTIYLNGAILYRGTPSGGTLVTYPFRRGLNVLEVIVSTGPAPVTVSLDINVNVLSLGSITCANSDPMTSVTLFNLRYNTNNQYNVYTLYQVDNKYLIIVKDPDLSINYEFVYDCVNVPVDNIIVISKLKREHPDVNVTPKLLSYEVRFM